MGPRVGRVSVVVLQFLILVVMDAMAGELPVPSEDKLKETAALIEEVYGEARKKKDKPGKVALARLLIQDSRKSGGDPAVRYAMLDQAIDAAIAGEDLPLALQAVRLLSRIYDVNPFIMRGKTISTFAKQAKGSDDREAAAKAFLCLGTDALDQEEFKVAGRALRDAEELARRTRNKELRSAIKEASDKAEATEECHSRAERARTVLEADAENASANHALGSYLAIIRGDWAEGLPYLAKSDREKIAKAAQLELSRAAGSEEIAERADAWWELAEEADGLESAGLKFHASHLYSQAVGGLSGFKAKLVQKRIDEVGPLLANATAARRVRPQTPATAGAGVQRGTEPDRTQTNTSTPPSAREPIASSSSASDTTGQAVLYANCDNEFELRLNGERVLSGGGYYVQQKRVGIGVSDVITVKAVNRGMSRGFAFVCTSGEGKSVFSSSSDTWKSYTPSNDTQWYETKGARDIGTTQTASNQAWKAHVEKASGCQTEAIWGDGRKDVVYLAYRVTAQDAQKLKKPTRLPEPRAGANETPSDALSRSGCVLSYRFDSAAEFTQRNAIQYVRDRSGQDNHGMVMGGAVQCAGVTAGGLMFPEDKTAYIRIPASKSLDLQNGDAITVAVWANIKKGSRRGKNWLVLGPGYTLIYNYQGHHCIKFSVPGIIAAGRTSNWQLDEAWHHFAGTYDPKTQTARVYIDGELDGEFQGVPTQPSSGDLYMMAGAKHMSPLHGKIDDFRIWKRCLSETELRDISRKVRKED